MKHILSILFSLLFFVGFSQSKFIDIDCFCGQDNQTTKSYIQGTVSNGIIIDGSLYSFPLDVTRSGNTVYVSEKAGSKKKTIPLSKTKYSSVNFLLDKLTSCICSVGDITLLDFSDLTVQQIEDINNIIETTEDIDTIYQVESGSTFLTVTPMVTGTTVTSVIDFDKVELKDSIKACIDRQDFEGNTSEITDNTDNGDIGLEHDDGDGNVYNVGVDTIAGVYGDTLRFDFNGQILDVCIPKKAPLAFKECHTTAPNVPITYDVCFNDIAQDSPLDPASFEFKPNGGTTATGSQGGSYVYNGDCTVTYTPVPNTTNYSDTTYYCIKDQDGDVSNNTPIVDSVEGVLCPTCRVTNNDADGCAFDQNNSFNMISEFEFLDGFGNALTSSDQVELRFSNCEDGSDEGVMIFDGDNLTTPTGGDSDIIANSTITGTGTTLSLALNARSLRISRGQTYECSFDYCITPVIISPDCGEVLGENNSRVWRNPRTIGFMSAISITPTDGAANQSIFQHQGKSTWLEDSTGECTLDAVIFTSGWPAQSEGTTEISTIWYTQDPSDPEGVISAINGNNLQPFDGVCPAAGGGASLNPPLSTAAQFGDECAFPSYVNGTSGEAYLVVDGTNSDGLRSIATGYVMIPNLTASGGGLFISPISNHAITFPTRKTKNTVWYQFFNQFQKTISYSGETVQTATLNIYKEGIIDDITTGVSIPLPTTVTGGTLVYTANHTPTAAGFTAHNAPNVDYEEGKKYQFEYRIVFDSGRELLSIHEIQIKTEG